MEMGLIQVNVPELLKSVQHTESPEDILKRYTDVFDGLGCLPGEYHLEIDKTIPPVKNQPRRVAVAIKEELKLKLNDLEERQIIAKVSEPTEWISSMVIVKKPGKMRLCIDPKPLNTALKRPHYMLPTVDDVLPKLTKARVFTVLDAKDGFWQIKMDQESSLLTTFGTPFGRYRWLRMPFGIATAPEEFQRRQHEIVEDLPGVEVIADDYIIYGSGDSDEEAAADHNRNLERFLEKARKVNLKINSKQSQAVYEECSIHGTCYLSRGTETRQEQDQSHRGYAPTREQASSSKAVGMRYLLIQVLTQTLPGGRTTTTSDRQGSSLGMARSS